MKNLVKNITIGALVVLPLLSFAQSVPVNPPTSGVTSLNDISRIIGTIINWLMGIFFAIAILFLFWAAFTYLVAGGDEKKVGEAKNRLIYSIIAIAIALLAGSIRLIIESILQ